MITLRENQTEAVAKAVAFFRERNLRPGLIVLPTAWGKSILTAFVALECNDRLIVLQPSKELLEQNYGKYADLCGGMALNAGIYSASMGRKDVGQVTYATIGSIKDLGAEFRRMGFTKMLIDEAHLYPRSAKSMLGKFLKDSGITHVLGITATPLKLQSNMSRGGQPISKLVMLTNKSKEGNFFRDIIHVGQVSEMVRLGYWSPLRYEVAEFDGGLLRFNTAGSEYTEQSVQAAYAANGGTRRLVTALDAHPERRHVLAFAPSVQEARTLAMFYPDSGVVYGEQDKREREDVIARFRRGELRVLFNVRVLSTGFDYTGIDCVVLGISTASVSLYYQILGRGTRIDPLKKDCLIVDLCGNVSRFGRVEDITFEQGASGLWRMFGSGGRLLTGIPVTEIGGYTREDVQRLELAAAQVKAAQVMPFGKYKGVSIGSVPVSYRRWMMKTFRWDSRNEGLRKALAASMGGQGYGR